MSSQENPAVPASERKANVAVACGFYEAADVPAMLEFVDPQIEWRGPDSLPWRGTFPGHDGFHEFLATVADRIARFPGDKQQYLDTAERIVALLRSIGRAKGGTEWDLPRSRLDRSSGQGRQHG